jgi:preprotein translocase subunit YajC
MDDDFIEFEADGDSVVKSMLLLMAIGFIGYMYCVLTKKNDKKDEKVKKTSSAVKFEDASKSPTDS